MASEAPCAGWEAGGILPLLPEKLKRGSGLCSVVFLGCFIFLLLVLQSFWLLQSCVNLCDQPKTEISMPLVMQDTLRSPYLLL